MSTPTRAELGKRVSNLGMVSEQLIKELRILDDRVAGLFTFIQMLPDYEETVEKLKAKAKESEDDNKA